MSGLPDLPVDLAGWLPEGTAPVPAPLSALQQTAADGLADKIKALVDAGGPALTPAAVGAAQVGSVQGLLQGMNGIAGEIAPGGADRYAPSGRLLAQATDKMAAPGAPAPAAVALAMLARQPDSDPGMLADGADGLLPAAARSWITR